MQINCPKRIKWLKGFCICVCVCVFVLIVVQNLNVGINRDVDYLNVLSSWRCKHARFKQKRSFSIPVYKPAVVRVKKSPARQENIHSLKKSNNFIVGLHHQAQMVRPLFSSVSHHHRSRQLFSGPAFPRGLRRTASASLCARYWAIIAPSSAWTPNHPQNQDSRTF